MQYAGAFAYRVGPLCAPERFVSRGVPPGAGAGRARRPAGTAVSYGRADRVPGAVTCPSRRPRRRGVTRARQGATRSRCEHRAPAGHRTPRPARAPPRRARAWEYGAQRPGERASARSEPASTPAGKTYGAFRPPRASPTAPCRSTGSTTPPAHRSAGPTRPSLAVSGPDVREPAADGPPAGRTPVVESASGVRDISSGARDISRTPVGEAPAGRPPAHGPPADERTTGRPPAGGRTAREPPAGKPTDRPCRCRTREPYRMVTGVRRPAGPRIVT